VLDDEVFCSFNQQEREEIWIQLQIFKNLISFLYDFFKNIKILEVWFNYLKWMICLNSWNTISTTLKNIFTDVNQNTESTLMQEIETLFKIISASFAYQRDLTCQQLWAFVMRYHCKIFRRFCEKNLLAKSMIILNTAKLREMIDLVNRLSFELSEIRVLQQYSRSQKTSVATENNRSMLITDDSEETRRERCEMSHIQSYEENRKFLFITHLHDDRNEQSERITLFFRLRFVYMKFYDMSCDVIDTTIDSSSQLHLITVINESQLSNLYSAQSISFKHMNIDEKQSEVEQIALRTENTFAQETLMKEQQRQEFSFNVNMFMKLEREQLQMWQQTEQETNMLREQEQE